MRSEQRGSNWHPIRTLQESGGSPGITANRPELRSPPTNGVFASCTKARVYGWSGCRKIWEVGPTSTICPAYITASRSAKPANRVGSWLITAIVSLLVLVLSMPLWFPWLLRPLGRRAGLHYQTYMREGYSRFNLGSVSYTNAHVHLTAWRIRLFVPSTWA